MNYSPYSLITTVFWFVSLYAYLCICFYINFISFLVHYTCRFGTQKRDSRADSHVYCSIFSLTKMSDLYNSHVISYILRVYIYLYTNTAQIVRVSQLISTRTYISI